MEILQVKGKSISKEWTWRDRKSSEPTLEDNKTTTCDSYLCNLEPVELLWAVPSGAGKQYQLDKRTAQEIKWIHVSESIIVHQQNGKAGKHRRSQCAEAERRCEDFYNVGFCSRVIV